MLLFVIFATLFGCFIVTLQNKRTSRLDSAQEDETTLTVLQSKYYVRFATLNVPLR